MAHNAILLSAYETDTLLAKTIDELNEAGVPRIRLLPNQQLKNLNGNMEDADTTLNIQCQATPRKQNPIGTIFEIIILEKLRHQKGDYYCAGMNKIIPKT